LNPIDAQHERKRVALAEGQLEQQNVSLLDKISTGLDAAAMLDKISTGLETFVLKQRWTVVVRSAL
jgi:ABC-type thiamine transport system ATPase subunit